MKLAAASSIQRKLSLILVATVGLALLLAAVALLLVEARRVWQDAQGELTSQAEVVGLASEAALAFGDRKVGEQNLRVLLSQPSVLAAALYDTQGRLFARFRRDDDGAVVPDTAPRPGLQFDWSDATVVRPVLSNQEVIGSIYVQNRHGLLPLMLEYTGWLAAIVLGSLVGALLLARRLQRTVTGPIEEVSRVARTVLERGSYDVRATRRSDDEVGQLVDAFNTMLDELGRRAHSLQESNRAKDAFLATLAHELRNPLAPLRTGLQILKQPHAAAAVQRRTLDTMDRQLTHMVRLVDDLLDISRINSGKIRLELGRTSLRAALQTALELARPAMDAAGHALQVELPEADIELRGDATRLAQAFGNLLNNAAKYTPPGGRVRLRAWREGELTLVEVEDNGIGIAPDMQDQVFDLFAQGAPGDGQLASGLGIGLFLVRSLVQMHGGEVRVRSAGDGQGSTFTVSLPCLPAAAPAPAAAAPAAGEALAAAPARVLVVDDNRDAAETLATFLEMLGLQTRSVYDGAEALPAARQFGPDVVLLDIGLPGMDGYEVARRLRADAQLAGVHLIALTGWGAEQDRQRALEAGFDHHLTKPVDLELLEGLLRRVQPQPRA